MPGVMRRKEPRGGGIPAVHYSQSHLATHSATSQRDGYLSNYGYSPFFKDTRSIDHVVELMKFNSELEPWTAKKRRAPIVAHYHAISAQAQTQQAILTFPILIHGRIAQGIRLRRKYSTTSRHGSCSVPLLWLFSERPATSHCPFINWNNQFSGISRQWADVRFLSGIPSHVLPRAISISGREL